MKYPIGTKIAFVAISQRGRRLDCTADFVRDTPMGPEFQISSPLEAFTSAMPLQFLPRFIEETPEGLRYKGDFSGGILLPEFLWKQP